MPEEGMPVLESVLESVVERMDQRLLDACASLCRDFLAAASSDYRTLSALASSTVLGLVSASARRQYLTDARRGQPLPS